MRFTRLTLTAAFLALSPLCLYAVPDGNSEKAPAKAEMKGDHAAMKAKMEAGAKEGMTKGGMKEMGPHEEPMISASALKGDKNLIDTAAAAGKFTTLLKAVEAAGLTETLKSGDYTILAPTDEAFKRIPAEKLATLMADKEGLKKVLLHHVIAGKADSAKVAGMTEATTLNKDEVRIKAMDGKVRVGRAWVIQADVPATNGTIHAIDAVLMPQWKKDGEMMKGEMKAKMEGAKSEKKMMEGEMKGMKHEMKSGS